MRPLSLRATPLRVLALSAVGLAVACSTPSSPPPPSPPAPTATAAPTPDAALPDRLVAEVTGDGAFRHLEELQRIADANGGNRALGTPGYDASVEYVARTLRDAGYTVDTPEFSARSFSVQDVRLTVDGALTASTALGFSPATPPGGVTAPLAVLAQDETSGCEAADFAGVPAGAVVLVRRGACPFGVRSRRTPAAARRRRRARGQQPRTVRSTRPPSATSRRRPDGGAEQGRRRRARRTRGRAGVPRAGDDDRGPDEPQRRSPRPPPATRTTS